MMRTLVRAAIALYPRAFRRRYGPELEQLALDTHRFGHHTPIRLLTELVLAAGAQRLGRRLPLAAIVAAAAVSILTVDALPRLAAPGPSALARSQPAAIRLAALPADLAPRTYTTVNALGEQTQPIARTSVRIVLDSNSGKILAIKHLAR